MSGPPAPTTPVPSLYADLLRPDAAIPPSTGSASLLVFREDPGARAAIISVLRSSLVSHYKGLKAISRLGFEKAAEQARVKMPTNKRTKSGELGEVLAAEYVARNTGFFLPLNKLQHKDSRELPLRGADILALRKDAGLPRVLKGESKSRDALGPAVVREAIDDLEKDGGRPSAFDWAFVTDHLWEAGQDDLAEFVENCQTSSTSDSHFEQMVFVLCGNDPAPRLTEGAGASMPPMKRRYVGVQVVGHSDLVDAVYASV